MLNVAQSKFSIFPVKLLLKDHYDSLSRAKHIQTAVLVLAAENDAVIPMHHTQKLIDAFRSDQVVLKVIKNSGHNSISNDPDYYKSLNDFITTIGITGRGINWAGNTSLQQYEPLEVLVICTSRIRILVL